MIDARIIQLTSLVGERPVDVRIHRYVRLGVGGKDPSLSNYGREGLPLQSYEDPRGPRFGHMYIDGARNIGGTDKQRDGIREIYVHISYTRHTTIARFFYP